MQASVVQACVVLKGRCPPSAYGVSGAGCINGGRPGVSGGRWPQVVGRERRHRALMVEWGSVVGGVVASSGVDEGRVGRKWVAAGRWSAVVSGWWRVV